MRLTHTLFLFFLLSTLSGWSQLVPVDSAIDNQPSRYLLRAKGPSGEIILTTGRIVKAIAQSRPTSMEIARIFVDYNVSIKLIKDISGESTAVISFTGLKLSGDLTYKGFDIRDYIFPSLVTFRLSESSTSNSKVKTKPVLVTVKAANVNQGDCSVSIALHKAITDLLIIDKIAFYHSADDYEVADNQIKLVDRYYAAGWLMQRTESLLDGMQYIQMHEPSAFLATNLEVIVVNDWITGQHFNRYPLFQKKDTLLLGKRMQINLFRKKLIEQDFIKSNVVTDEDLMKASHQFANNLSYYFDSGQPDYNLATFLSQMAESRITEVGYKAIRNFADSYAAVHKHTKIDWRLYVKAGTLIRNAMTIKATQLADNEQFSEAMGMLNASENYKLETGGSRSHGDSLLIGKLSLRLYNAYIDFALKSLNFGIYTVTVDYYEKAVLLKETYDGLITGDSRERYLADMICKSMLKSAEKSYKNNDLEASLAAFGQVIRIAESASLKDDYETARIRLETISNRPSGFKPYEGTNLAIIVPDEDINKSKNRALTDFEKNKLRENDTAVTIISAKQKGSALLIAKAKKDSILNAKSQKQVSPKIHLQDIKESAFLAKVIKRLQVNKAKKNVKDSLALSQLDDRIMLYQIKNIRDSINHLTALRKQLLAKLMIQNAKDSVLLTANLTKFQTLQLKLSNAVIPATANLTNANQNKLTPNRNPKIIKELLQTDTLKSVLPKKGSALHINEIRQQIAANINSLHLKIWSGDTISSGTMLQKTDSLQLILASTGDKSMESDIKALRINYEAMRCEQQKTVYLRNLDHITGLIKAKEFALGAKLLQQLIVTNFPVECKIDKSEALRILASLESPRVYKRWQIQLDSIIKTDDPEAIIAAFEKAKIYYQDNMIDKLGMEPPDLMTALKSRQEIPFLLKAVSVLLDTHRPAYALDLLKEIHKQESKPDITLSVQKRLGQMLASGDYAESKTVTDMLSAYNLNDKWYNELIVAYKKQWKLFSK